MTVNINNELSTFPTLRTRRITVDANEIKIDALISSQEDVSRSSWLSSSDFTRYVKNNSERTKKYDKGKNNKIGIILW